MNGDKPAWLTAIAGALMAAFALLTLSACTGDDADDVLLLGDEWRAPRSERAGRAEWIPPPVRNLAYFTITPDPRLCPSPLCGGFWVTRVNGSFTLCADGTLAPSCYVSDLDFSRSGLSEEQEASVRGAAGHLLMRGSIRAKTIPPLGTLGVFQAREAWLGHAGATATGTFYRARDTGIVCIAYPCLNVQIAPLDLRSPAQLIAGVDLSAVSADPGDGYAQLDEPQGLIVAGELVPVSGPAGSSVELKASEYYVLVLPESEVCTSRGVRACARGDFCDLGGKAQCGRAGLPGVCEPRPQACVEIFDPVCGCDGTSYSNACAAHAAGVGVDHVGPCP